MSDFYPILAYGSWNDNAELIADVARLGYLDGRVLDCTWGYGTFWKNHRPSHLTGCDLDAAKSPIGFSVDFTAMPFRSRSFDSVVFDPPYKLNGTPDDTVDERYGVHEVRTWQQRMALMRAGLVECLRVGDQYVLMKCQDQVSSARVRWQTFEFQTLALANGWGLKDEFAFPTYRPQPSANPDGSPRRQVHARRNVSSLLVFKRGWWTSDLPKPPGWDKQIP